MVEINYRYLLVNGGVQNDGRHHVIASYSTEAAVQGIVNLAETRIEGFVPGELSYIEVMDDPYVTQLSDPDQDFYWVKLNPDGTKFSSGQGLPHNFIEILASGFLYQVHFVNGEKSIEGLFPGATEDDAVAAAQALQTQIKGL